MDPIEELLIADLDRVSSICSSENELVESSMIRVQVLLLLLLPPSVAVAAVVAAVVAADTRPFSLSSLIPTAQVCVDGDEVYSVQADRNDRIVSTIHMKLKDVLRGSDTEVASCVVAVH